MDSSNGHVPPPLSGEAGRAILDALTYRNASPAMAAAMLRRVFLLSVASPVPEVRQEMSKYALSMVKVYPQAMKPSLIGEGYLCWKRTGIVDGVEFCRRVEKMLDEVALPPELAKDMFSALFETASMSWAVLGLGRALESHVRRHPDVLRGNPLLPRLAAQAETGWADMDRAAMELFFSRRVLDLCPDLACAELRDFALSAMGDSRTYVAREGGLLAVAVAREQPELFGPAQVTRMVGDARRNPFSDRDAAVLKVLSAVLPGNPACFVLPVEDFVVARLFALPPDNDSPRQAKRLLAKCLRKQPELGAPLLGRAVERLRKGPMVSWQARMAALKAVETCVAADSRLRDANLLEVLVEAGCRDADANVRDAARDLLAQQVREYDGSRKHLFAAALASVAHPLSVQEAESGRRVMVLLMENRLDDSENAGFVMLWEGIRNMTIRGDFYGQGALADMLAGLLSHCPGCANPLFVKELQDLRMATANPVGRLYLNRIFEKTLEKRPDLGPALLRMRPGCRPS